MIIQSSSDAAATPGDKSLHELARQLVGDLHRPRPAIFWTDTLVTASIGWAAFAGSVVLTPLSLTMLACVAVAVFALYRGLCFIHEISHINPKTLRGFETTWNSLFGVPLLMPSIVYSGVHQDHHKLSTYGTSQDPEYLPFARSHRMTVAFIAQSLLIPAMLLLRFLVLAPIGLLWPGFHGWLAVHATALSMNIAYCRPMTPTLENRMRRWEVAILACWGVALFFTFRGVIPVRTLAIWYTVTAIASLINTLRTLGAHRYESDGIPLDRTGQLRDSWDTPGAIWTELWAPVGLRYHALHHYFPGIPYHNLGEAYSRLIGSLPLDATYRSASSRSLWNSLCKLYRAGLCASRAAKRAALF
ncbi:MAG: fatty acid desaturase family protein [Bryobacteraceae bacterium]